MRRLKIIDLVAETVAERIPVADHCQESKRKISDATRTPNLEQINLVVLESLVSLALSLNPNPPIVS